MRAGAVGYIQQSLARDEHVLYRAHFHWLYRAAAWGLLLIFLIAALSLYQRDQLWIAVAPVCLGVVLFLAIMIPIWAQQIAVTENRLIYRRGLIRRSTEELQLSAIEEVRVEQSILGRLLGFGRLTVSGTGVEDLRLPALAEPVKLRQMIQEAITSRGVTWQPSGPGRRPTHAS